MDVGNAATWGPMAPEQLSEVLQMAAEVADTDPGHDLLTALGVLNKDALQSAGLPQLYEAELRQVARVLLTGIPTEGRADSTGGEVAAVNAWLAQNGRVQGHPGTPGKPLADLFRSAAERIGASPSDEPKAGA
jgi:hypothetical protein